MRTDKNDINACNADPIPECETNPNLVVVLPAATDVSIFSDTMVSFYLENKTQWAEKVRWSWLSAETKPSIPTPT